MTYDAATREKLMDMARNLRDGQPEALNVWWTFWTAEVNAALAIPDTAESLAAFDALDTLRQSVRDAVDEERAG